MAPVASEKGSVRSRVRSILHDIGLRPPVAQGRYVSNLNGRFGRKASAFFDEHDNVARGGDRSALYAAKNADTGLSLAIASQEFYPIHEAFLVWLVKEFPKPPGRVLDLGCEAGIVSLAISRLWPKTDVVGIDRESTAIEVANDLAGRLGSSNCDFFEADLHRITGELHGKFDLVIGLAVFHEVLQETAHEPPSVGDGFSLADTPGWDHGQEATLASLADVVAEGGLLVALSRWGFPEQTLHWIRAMESAGWETDFGKSYLLETNQRKAESELLPITVHHPSETVTAALVDDVLALHSYPVFRDLTEHLRLEGPAAEAVRRAFGVVDRPLGFELEYLNGSGTERVELLISGAVACVYHSSTRGMRVIQVGSVGFLTPYLGSVIEYVNMRRPFVEVRRLTPEGDSGRWEKYGWGLTELESVGV